MEKVYTNFENIKFQEPLDVRPLVVRPLVVRLLVVKTAGFKNRWL